MRPNIVWFCSDQQRFDTVEALGNPHIRTPALNRLCETGVAFRRAYSQSPICTASRSSFLTGRYPATHHVYRNGNEYFPASEKLVTRQLADSGYTCGLIGKLHISAACRGYEPRVDDGYASWEWSFMSRPDDGTTFQNAYHQWLRAKGVDPAELYASVDPFMGPGVPAMLHQNEWIAQRAEHFIENTSGPWELSINPFDPHGPFDPAPEYLDRLKVDDMPDPLFRPEDIERQKEFSEIQQQSMEAIDPNDPANAYETGRRSDDYTTTLKPPSGFYGKQVIAHYYAMVMHIDAIVGRILDVLERTGQLENTIFVFHSDHGELLGDHGLIYKGCRFFEGLVHVPLIVSWPGQFRQGVVSDALVELVDIAPTLLDVLGLGIHDEMQGRSFAGLLTGEATEDRHKDVVVTDFNESMAFSTVAQPSHATMSFDGRYKMAVYHDRNVVELFDLEEDPGEFRNLWHEISEGGDRAGFLLRHMDAVMATVGAGPRRIGPY